MAKKSPPSSPQPGVMTHLPPELSPDVDGPQLPEFPAAALTGAHETPTPAGL